MRQLINIQIDGIDTKDYPDFVDAYVSSACYKDSGIELTEEELDYINNTYPHVVQELVQERNIGYQDYIYSFMKGD